MTTTTHWQHLDDIRTTTRAAGMSPDGHAMGRVHSMLRALDAQIRGDLTETQEQALDRLWGAVVAASEEARLVPAPNTAPVIALLLHTRPSGEALTASIRKDDAEGSGYTIPEIVVGSDGVHDCGPPHFSRLGDATAWARRAGWRVMVEQEPQRDPIRGDASQPRPSAGAAS